MRRIRLVCAGTMALAALLAGCVSSGPAGPSYRHDQVRPSPVGELVGSRPVLPSPDVTALASYETPADGLPPSGSYRVLKAFDAQCAAAAHCPLANALAEESRIVASQAGLLHASQRSADVRRQALLYRAADERNHAAGRALELFYLLAEAEADRDLLAQSTVRVDATLEEVRDLQSHGIRVEKGAAEIRRQQLELLDKRSELQLSLAQANSGLRQLMGSNSEETTPFWPEANWKVTAEMIDARAAVSDGLYRRADLNLLRMLIQSLEADTLDGVRLSLSAITGTAGAPAAAACLLHVGSGDEVGSRRRQLDDLLARQELAAAEEIRQAVFAVEIRLQQVATPNRKVEYCREQLQVQRLSRERPGSTVTALDIAAADLKLLDARRELVHQVTAWRIAQVKLKEAQGLLVFECCNGNR